MNKFQRFCMNTRRFLVKHGPEIATGIGVIGMVGSTVLAVKATPKAMELLNEKKRELEKDELTPLETIKAAWKPYIPSAVLGAASAGCIIGGSVVNSKRNAALIAAYKLSEGTLALYKSKVVETVGKEKEKVIKDKAAQEMVNKVEKTNTPVICASKGETLFIDSISGRPFKSDMNTVDRAINEINRKLNYQDYVSLDEFYGEIGLPSTSVSTSLGWNIIDGLVEKDMSACITESGEPAIVLDFMVRPRYRFDHFA